MTDFLILKVGYWILQWARLLSALIAIITFNRLDPALRVEGIYLDIVGKFKFNQARNNP